MLIKNILQNKNKTKYAYNETAFHAKPKQNIINDDKFLFNFE